MKTFKTRINNTDYTATQTQPGSYRVEVGMSRGISIAIHTQADSPLAAISQVATENTGEKLGVA